MHKNCRINELTQQSSYSKEVNNISLIQSDIINFRT